MPCFREAPQFYLVLLSVLLREAPVRSMERQPGIAVLKNALRYLLHTGGKGNIFQPGTLGEGLFAQCFHAIRDGDFSQLFTVRKSILARQCSHKHINNESKIEKS